MKLTEERLKADECDSAGDHTGAIKWLVAAAQKSDPTALTLLGSRYLLGDRAPSSPPHGVQLLQKGAEAGQAEASLLLSVLFSLGAYTEQNWNHTFNYLVLAATQGSEDAREQLLLLSSNHKLASQRRSTPDYWVELARSIDLQHWHSAATVQQLCANPKIVQVSNLVPKDMCQWLTRKAKGRLNRAMVYDSYSKQTIAHHTRTNSSAIFGILDTSVLITLIQTKIAASAGFPLRQLEPATVLHYQGGEEIQNHYDFIDPNSPDYRQQIEQRGERVITFLIYLNDNYTAGETDFPKAGLTYKGKRGEGLYFVNITETGSPNLEAVHAGKPPTQGEKWVLTQFIRNKAVF